MNDARYASLRPRDLFNKWPRAGRKPTLIKPRGRRSRAVCTYMSRVRQKKGQLAVH
jgi:hypothetical protein